MKKGLIVVFGIIIILVFLVILAKKILPIIVSSKLSKITEVSISIEDIGFSSSTIKAENIHIGNPKGYDKTPHALSVDTLTLRAPLSHFFKDYIVIDEMSLDKVHMGLQFDSLKSSNGNWTIIMNTVSKNISSNQKPAKETNSKILIKQLIIKNLQVELSYTEGGQANQMLKPIEQIELKNISSTSGVSLGQIMNIVIREVLRNVLSIEGLQNMLEGIIKSKGKEKKVIDTIKGFFSNVIVPNDDWENFTIECSETSL